MDEDWKFNLLVAVIILIPLYLIGSWIYVATTSNNHWKNEVYSEWTLSDQSSTVAGKLDHLKKFKKNLEDKNLTTGNAAYFFKNPSNDLTNNVLVLDTLITRLEEASKLSPTSLEYQEAIKQITNDEFQGFNTCVFATKWKMNKGIMTYLFGSATCQDGNYSGSSQPTQ